MHELNARQQLAFFAAGDRLLDGPLAELIDGDDSQAPDASPRPRRSRSATGRIRLSRE
jgi:hypothetical protein